MTIDHTHDPDAVSWLPSAQGHVDFPVQNLPFGIFSPPASHPRPGVAIGDRILNLAEAVEAGLVPHGDLLRGSTLNALLADNAARRALRHRLFALLTGGEHRAAVEPLLHRADACTLHLPVAIGDYSDFYVGIHHATNVGRVFRPENPLLPNYKHVPIGYHGRASSIRPSGVPVVRPLGQHKTAEADAPDFGPAQRLDYELELGLIIGAGNQLGTPIAIGAAGAHVAGICLLNDWSARDLQAWEYQPLGPFLAKNFHSTISPWVVTAEALAPFRVAQAPRPADDPRPLPYLWDAEDQASGGLAVTLEVSIATKRMREAGLPPHRLAQASSAHMYWTPAQIVAHHSSNGCNLNPGDLLGTGTISGPGPGGYGSLLEATEGGRTPITLAGGETRLFLEDGDTVVMSATARAPGRVPIGFGECYATVLPSPDWP